MLDAVFTVKGSCQAAGIVDHTTKIRTAARCHGETQVVSILGAAERPVNSQLLSVCAPCSVKCHHGASFEFENGAGEIFSFHAGALQIGCHRRGTYNLASGDPFEQVNVMD